MADQKLSALSQALVASANDLFYMVTTAGVSQKIPFSTMKTSLSIPAYAASGNKYIMTDTGADTISSFRLVQSGPSVTISTAGNNIVISALTGNLSTKQDTITYPLGINSGGTGLASVISATNLIGFNSSGTTAFDSYRLAASDNMTIVRVGTAYLFSANTGTGASTSGIVYAPTGGFYITWSSDTLLASEKIFTASDNVVVTTGASNVWISATTADISGKQGSITFPLIVGSGGTGRTTSGNYATLLGASGGLQYFAIQASDNVTIVNAGTSIFISAVTGAGGSGDITSVGNVASGAAFDGTQGTTLTFFETGVAGDSANFANAFFMYRNSDNTLPSTPSRITPRGDFFIGMVGTADSGAHIMLTPDNGSIHGWAATGENAGGNFESYGGPESFLGLNGAQGTYAVPVVSSAGDLVGAVYFGCYDGTVMSNVAEIQAYAVGNIGVGSSPGRIEFYTTSAGSSTAAKRFAIDNSGIFLFTSSGGFDTTLNVHRATAARTIFTPDSSGTLAINARYPILLSTGGNLSVGTGSLGQMLITSGGVTGDVAWVGTGGGASGSGVVNAGSAGNLAYYANAGTAVDDLVIGSANTLLGVNSSAGINEYKTLVAGNNVTITYQTTGITIAATTGGPGTGTVNSGSAGYLAYYPSAGTTVDDVTLSVTTGSGVAPINVTILTSNAASPVSGDVFFISSNGTVYLRLNSSGTIYSVEMGAIA